MPKYIKVEFTQAENKAQNEAFEAKDMSPSIKDPEVLASELNLDSNWIEDPVKAGLSVVDSKGGEIKSSEDYQNKLKEGSLYFYTKDKQGPFSISLDKEGKPLVREYPEMKEQKAVPSLTDYEILASELGLDPKWIDDPAKAGVNVINAKGEEIKSKEDFQNQLKQGTLYFFSKDKQGPFSISLDKSGNALVSEEPLKTKDLVNLGNEPVFNTDPIKINQPKVAKTVVEKPEILKTRASEKFRDKDFYYEDETPPEEAPEDVLPEAPKELTKAQKRWSNFVKFFNKKGSKKQQEYERKTAERNAAKESYSAWRSSFVEKAATYNAEKTQAQQEYNRQKAAAEARDKDGTALGEYYLNEGNLKIDSIKTKDQSLGEEEYYAKLADYHINVRETLAENPVAGMANYKENGLTFDNISFYEKNLATSLNNKKYDGASLSDEAKFEIAQYLRVEKANIDIGSALAKKKHSNPKTIDSRNKFEKIKGLIDGVNDPEETRKFMETDFFKEIMQGVEKCGVINKENLNKVYNKAYFDQSKGMLKRAQKEYLTQLRNNPPADKVEELFVKAAWIKKDLEAFDGMVIVNGYTNNLEAQTKYARGLLKNTEKDFSVLSKRQAEIKQKYPNIDNELFSIGSEYSQMIDEHSYKFKQETTPEMREKVEYYLNSVAINQYNEVKESIPNLEEKIEGFQLISKVNTTLEKNKENGNPALQ